MQFTYSLHFTFKIGEELAYKFLCKTDFTTLEESNEQDEDEDEEQQQIDQGQNSHKNENGNSSALKKNGKIPGKKRGRKANTNHKENLSSKNSCANNTRSKCRKSRSGRSIRNSTRLSSLNYNDDHNDERAINELENNLDSIDNVKQQQQQSNAIRARRGKQIKLDNSINCIDQQQLVNNNNTICTSASKETSSNTVNNKNKMMTNQNEIKLDVQMNDQLQFTDCLNDQRQIGTLNHQTTAATPIGKQSDDELNNNSKSNCNNLYTMNKCIQQQQHNVNITTANNLQCSNNVLTNNNNNNNLQQQHQTNGDYITTIENDSNTLHFMQMHGYSLTTASQSDINNNNKQANQHFNLNKLLDDKLVVGGTFNCKNSFMQNLNESHQINGNDAIMSTENTIDDQNTVKESLDSEEYEDLDEIQRPSLILDHDNNNSMQQQTKNNVLQYTINSNGGLSNMATINGTSNNTNNNNLVYNQQQQTSTCCSINSINTSTSSMSSSLHQNANSNLLDKCEVAVTASSNGYTLCCSIPPAQSIQSIAYNNQCLDRTLDRSTINISSATTSASFTQSNPLLASTDLTVTSLTSMSPVQISSKTTLNSLTNENNNTQSNDNQAMLQVLTNSSNTNNGTIELIDGLNGLNSLSGQQQSTLIHYSPVQQHSSIAHLQQQTNKASSSNHASPLSSFSTNNINYSNGIRDQHHHHLIQQNQLIQNHSSLNHLQSPNSTNQQINLLSNTSTDHLYHNTLDSTTAICSSDCTDLLEQYQLEPINNLLNSKKTSFTEFDEQLENENNLNNINANSSFSLDLEKDVVYSIISSNNQNVSFLF